MDGQQIIIVGLLSGSLEIHGSEHVESGAGGHSILIELGGGARVLLVLLRVINSASLLPARLRATKDDGIAVVASSNDLIFGGPHQRSEGLEGGVQVDDSFGGSIGSRRVDHSDGGVVGNVGQRVSGRREGHVVNPGVGLVGKLTTKMLERQSLSPGGGGGFGVNTLDVAGEDSGVSVRGSGGQQNVVGVPRNAGDCGSDGLLDVLGDPPVVLGLEVAHGNDSRSGSYGKLGSIGRPSHGGGGSVDSQHHQEGLPGTVLLQLPNSSVSVLRTGDNSAITRDIHTGHGFVVESQSAGLARNWSNLAVGSLQKSDIVLSSHGNEGVVLVEGVVSDSCGSQSERFHGDWLF